MIGGGGAGGVESEVGFIFYEKFKGLKVLMFNSGLLYGGDKIDYIRWDPALLASDIFSFLCLFFFCLFVFWSWFSCIVLLLCM